MLVIAKSPDYDFKMKFLKKSLAFVGFIPGGALFVFGVYSAAVSLLNQIMSDFIDFTNFNLINLFNPTTSVGGSGTFLDSVVAGPGASGGSAVRYWMYMVYALLAAGGYGIISTCWKALKNEN
jgi:hypothetical protein